MTARRCKECPADSKRPANFPGPRCHSHDREVRRARRARAHAKHLERTYGGLTAEEYQTILEYQGGVCFLCRRATGKTRRLSVDHDHVTGQVRGLLCRPCNDVLGHARDDRGFFFRAGGYLGSPPALAAGIDRKVAADAG